MPGMVEAHTHFSWNDQPTLDSIQRMPPEEHILWCAGIAERYLDMGWTSCVGAAAAKPRLDVVIRNAINDGTIVGPRYLAASQEITVPGGLGDETLPVATRVALAACDDADAIEIDLGRLGLALPEELGAALEVEEELLVESLDLVLCPRERHDQLPAL